MPQFVIVGLGIILLFKESFEALFSTIFKSKESKAVGIAIAAYFLYVRVFPKERKESLLANAGSDVDTQNAVALFSALHPVFSSPVFGWYPPDGTNEAAAYEIARKYVGRFKVLSERYKAIYNLDLVLELQSEGINNQFMAIINGQAGGESGIRVGSTLNVRAGWEIRDYNTGSQIGTTAQGDKFRVLDVVENATIAGTLGTWVRVTYYPTLISMGKDAWINSGAFNA